MEVIGIDERPVDVEDHGLRHAIQIPFVVETPNARSIRKFERNCAQGMQAIRLKQQASSQ
jgi:hypothetical protein